MESRRRLVISPPHLRIVSPPLEVCTYANNSGGESRERIGHSRTSLVPSTRGEFKQPDPIESPAQEPRAGATLVEKKASTLYLCRQLTVREFSQVGGATASQQQREDHTKYTRPRPPKLRVEHRDCVEHAQLGERTSQPGERCA